MRPRWEIPFPYIIFTSDAQKSDIRNPGCEPWMLANGSVHTMFGLSTWYTPCLDSLLLARDEPSLAEHHHFFAPPLRLPSPTPGPRLTLPTPSRHGCATAGISTGWLGDTYPDLCPHLHILLSLRDLSLRHHGQNTWEFPLRATYRIRQHL